MPAIRPPSSLQVSTLSARNQNSPGGFQLIGANGQRVGSLSVGPEGMIAIQRPQVGGGAGGRRQPAKRLNYSLAP